MNAPEPQKHPAKRGRGETSGTEEPYWEIYLQEFFSSTERNPMVVRALRLLGEDGWQAWGSGVMPWETNDEPTRRRTALRRIALVCQALAAEGIEVDLEHLAHLRLWVIEQDVESQRALDPALKNQPGLDPDLVYEAPAQGGARLFRLRHYDEGLTFLHEDALDITDYTELRRLEEILEEARGLMHNLREIYAHIQLNDTNTQRANRVYSHGRAQFQAIADHVVDLQRRAFYAGFNTNNEEGGTGSSNTQSGSAAAASAQVCLRCALALPTQFVSSG